MKRIVTILLAAVFLAGCTSHSQSGLPVVTETSLTPEVILTATTEPTFTPIELTKTQTLTATTGPTQTPTIEPTPIDCENERTQYELTVCAGQRAQEKYDQLTALLEDLHDHLGDTEFYVNLLEVEEEWEAAAEAHCEWNASFFEGGSIQRMWYANCMAGQYSMRIDMLRISLCVGNGLAGECEESLRYRQHE